MAVSSAVSGTAEQTGDSSVRVRGKSYRGPSVKLWEDTEVNYWGLEQIDLSLAPPHHMESETTVVSLILINTNNLNLSFEVL